MNDPPPRNWDYTRDLNIKALKGGGFVYIRCISGCNQNLDPPSTFCIPEYGPYSLFKWYKEPPGMSGDLGVYSACCSHERSCLFGYPPSHCHRRRRLCGLGSGVQAVGFSLRGQGLSLGAWGSGLGCGIKVGV